MTQRLATEKNIRGLLLEDLIGAGAVFQPAVPVVEISMCSRYVLSNSVLEYSTTPLLAY